MIQFNLLPAVKLEYVKTQRQKRLTILIASIVAGVSLTILVLLLIGVQVVQKKHSKDLSADIKQQTSELQNTEDLNKILTIQNQLGSLTALHDQKPVASRLFTFMKQVTPANVSIATMNVDFEAKTITLTGAAPTIGDVNKFVDTLKFTTFKAGDADAKNAFTGVVLTSFGKDANKSSYQISLVFDEAIFSSANDIKLDVPTGKTTSRSETEKPDSLFQPLTNSGGQ